MMRVWRLSVWRLSRSSGLSREQRGLGKLKLAQRYPTLHVTRKPLLKSKGQRPTCCWCLNSQHAGTGATWRINTKILSTCRPGRGHIVPASQLVFGNFDALCLLTSFSLLLDVLFDHAGCIFSVEIRIMDLQRSNPLGKQARGMQGGQFTNTANRNI